MKTQTKLAGAGIAAAVAAAGVYFLYGKRGAKNREKIQGWALKLKGDVLERLETVKVANQEAYNALVDEAAVRYARVKRVSASELSHVTGEIKGAWTHIAKQLDGQP